MDAQTQAARNHKADQLRLCRRYLAKANRIGLTDKSTTVRYWKQTLAEWRAMPIRGIQT